MTEAMTCSSCNKSKASVVVKSSSLLPGMTVYLCSTCSEHKYEPRWMVILAARTYGIARVRDIILKDRYLGQKISAHEIIK